MKDLADRAITVTTCKADIIHFICEERLTTVCSSIYFWIHADAACLQSLSSKELIILIWPTAINDDYIRKKKLHTYLCRCSWLHEWGAIQTTCVCIVNPVARQNHRYV